MQPSRNLLQQLFSRGPVAMFVWRAEPGWPVEFVSDSVLDLLGHAPCDFVRGQVLYADLVHEEDLGRVERAVANHAAGGSAHFTHPDYRLLHRDGHWVWVSDTTAVSRDEQGKIEAFHGYLVDVTLRRQSEEALEEHRQRMELVIEGTRLGMWDWNPQNNDVAYNPRWAEMLGHDLSEIAPSLAEWERRVHPDDLAGCRAAIQAHIAGKVPFYENVHRMRHKDGHWVYILDRGKIVERDNEGRPLRFTGTHTDITAQKEAELAAQEATRAKSLFLANMSHEIRTPLNGVLGVVQLLEGTTLTDEQREYVGVIRESGEGLQTLINDILDFSKIEAGRMTIDAHTFSLMRSVRAVQDLYRERAISKGLELKLQADADLPQRVVGDSHRIKQILLNLVSNAIKFTDEGRVEIIVETEAAESGGHGLSIRVRDTGKGIDDVDRIWEEFRQEDASISRTHGGTGLGLAISRRLAKLMGGTIDVTSTVGEGSCFRLFVPVGLATAAGRSPEAAAGSDAPPPRLDVLVAEDNAINEMVIRRVLDRLGSAVDVVRNGLEAVEACKKRDYDLVLMDIHMPTLDGIEATRQIRKERTRETGPRIVGLSADAFEENRAECVAAGMDDFLAKPFKIGDVIRLLRETGSGRIE